MIDRSKRSLRKKIYWMLAKIAVRLIEPFIQCHMVNSHNIKNNLHKMGVKKDIEFLDLPLCYADPQPKVKHDGFNVLYYFPDNFSDGFAKWLYGYDIFLKVQNTFKDVNFIIVNGSSDMSKIYPITDFYLRCNRHDGHSHMIRECEIQGIPYYYSTTFPSVSDVVDAINKYKK